MASTPRSVTSLDAAAGIERHCRLVVGAGVALLLASWGYVIYMAWGMANMEALGDSLFMPSMMNWSGRDALLVFFMWAVMMIAMMTPSAIPLWSLVSKIHAERYRRERALLATAVFVLGYFAVWTGFSLLAALAQWSLLEARLISPMMDSASPYLSAALLAAAGAYEFTPLKNACLSYCRSPLAILLTEPRHDMRGAFFMGLRQGAYCTACCWLLMLLLFAFGVMNVVWIAALSVLVLMEKLLRRPAWFPHAVGAALLAWAVAMLLRSAQTLA